MQHSLQKRLNTPSKSQVRQGAPQKKLKLRIETKEFADCVSSKTEASSENDLILNGFMLHDQQEDHNINVGNVSDVSKIPLPEQIIECVLNETDVPQSRERSPSISPTPQDNRTEANSNLGSEVESDDDDTEDYESVFLSRVQRIFMTVEAEDTIEQHSSSKDEQSSIHAEKLKVKTDKPFTKTKPLKTTKECLFKVKESLTQDKISSQADVLSLKADKLTTKFEEFNSQKKDTSNNSKFDWEPLPSPPIPSQQRRELFKTEIDTIKEFATPYEAFVAIWDENIMNYIAKETNRYAAQSLAKLRSKKKLTEGSRLNRWSDTNTDELYVFFALVLATGICIKQDIKEYFRVDGKLYDTPNFKEAMTYNRFLLINKFLHFNDNKNITGLSLTAAKLFKIQPIVIHLNERFTSLYKLDRNIVIDNSLSNFKGWLIKKGFSRHNAASGKLDTIELCESKTGYLWRFDIYDGKQNKIASRVLKLLDGLENKGYAVFMDQYYTSPVLARILKSKSFDCVGTLSTDCQFFPNELSRMKKIDMQIGESMGYTSGDVDIIVWRERNKIALLSTYHGNPALDPNCNEKPIALTEYQLCISGLDKRDEMLGVYPIERKNTKTWYKILFRRLLNISVYNSLILHKNAKASTRSKVQIITHHRSYREELVQQIIQKHTLRPTIHPVKVSMNGKPIFPAEYWEHFPAEYGVLSGPKRERIRKSCVVCHKRMQTYCPGCNVPLCAFTCHRVYHTE